MSRLQLAVRGTRPKPWATNEWAWRAVLAERARAVCSAAEFQAPPSDACFAVDLRFFFMPEAIARVDLDNLAKPVLDTLFLPRNPQVKDRSLTGAAFKLDDDRVYNLSLAKLRVATESEEGVDVVITW